MKKLKLCAAICILGAILLNPEPAVAGAQRAMTLWVSSVAPALFPFLVLMPALTGPEACAAYERLFGKWMGKIFRLPGAAAPAVIIGMISGAPGGSIAVVRVAVQSGMNRRDACRIALTATGLSPAYLILGVGQGIFNSPALGMRLACIQAAVQLALLLFSRNLFKHMEGRIAPAPEGQKNQPVHAAVETTLAVCGYMVLFSSIAGVVTRGFSSEAGSLLLLLADLPSGMPALADWNLPGKMFIIGGAMGFGGLCICTQNLDALRPLNIAPGDYFAMRIIAAAPCACLCSMFAEPGMDQAGNLLSGAGNTYAVSLFFAMICVLPALIYFSNTYFLNKGKSPDESA